MVWNLYPRATIWLLEVLTLWNPVICFGHGTKLLSYDIVCMRNVMKFDLQALRAWIIHSCMSLFQSGTQIFIYMETIFLNHKRCTAFWMEMLAPISADNSEVLRLSSIYFVVLNYKLASILAKFIKRCWCLNTWRVSKLPNLPRDPWPDEWKLLPPKRRLLLHLSRNWNSE